MSLVHHKNVRRTSRRSRRFTQWLAVGALSSVLFAMVAFAGIGVARSSEMVSGTPPPATPDFELVAASARYLNDLDLLVFELEVAGEIGATLPDPRGDLDGAPVLAYIIPTTLAPDQVGFTADDGLVALAITSHPDFDDTPLWDENGDGDYTNDGVTWHTHWVLVVPDDRVPGGLAVKAVANDADRVLPPTHPGLPIYLDSPGFSVTLSGNVLRAIVPAPRLGDDTTFTFDAVTAYLEVNVSDDARPMLGVYQVYDVMSGDLRLPYTVDQE